MGLQFFIRTGAERISACNDKVIENKVSYDPSYLPSSNVNEFISYYGVARLLKKTVLFHVLTNASATSLLIASPG